MPDNNYLMCPGNNLNFNNAHEKPEGIEFLYRLLAFVYKHYFAKI